VYHLFVVRTERRAALQDDLAAAGVQTLIHYPVPISRQPALSGASPAVCPEADRACADVLSLPLHPGLTRQAVEEVAAALDAFHAPA
jgi:dTDP-4-amino-4,6-dideoxygalactose transaminase